MRNIADAAIALAFAWTFIGAILWVAWMLVETFGFWSPLVVIGLFVALAFAVGD